MTNENNYPLTDGEEEMVIELLMTQGAMMDSAEHYEYMRALMALSKKYGAEYIAEAIHRIRSDMKLINDALNDAFDVGSEFDGRNK